LLYGMNIETVPDRAALRTNRAANFHVDLAPVE
jgi:hypothetical protein